MTHGIKKADVIFLAVVAVLICGAFLGFCLLHRTPGAGVYVEYDGEIMMDVSLEEDARIPLTFHDGDWENTLVIEKHKARMEEANCPDKLCVHQSAIGRNDETIVCLPHKLVIRVHGAEDKAYDAIAN